MPQSLNEPRFLHTATRLPDGSVLFVGGRGSSGASLISAELYDPTAETFSETAPLMDARDSATATLMISGPLVGQVLIAGGEQVTASSAVRLGSAEIYDPNSTPPSFSCVGGLSADRSACNSSMNVARYLHAATFLPDANNAVLITGGIGNGGTATAAAELFEPGANGGSFMMTGNMTEPRVGHTATYLDPASVSGPLAGKVLIAGGTNDLGTNDLTAEIYDPQTSTFSCVGTSASPPCGASMNAVHSFHTATLLKNGKVLIAGGGAGTFSDLIDGKFIAEPIAEIFDPATETFVLVAGNMVSERALQTATLLNLGQVLIAGGETTGSVQAGAELFVPAADPAATCAVCSR